MRRGGDCHPSLINANTSAVALKAMEIKLIFYSQRDGLTKTSFLPLDISREFQTSCQRLLTKGHPPSQCLMSQTFVSVFVILLGVSPTPLSDILPKSYIWLLSKHSVLTPEKSVPELQGVFKSLLIFSSLDSVRKPVLGFLQYTIDVFHTLATPEIIFLIEATDPSKVEILGLLKQGVGPQLVCSFWDRPSFYNYWN